MLDLRMTMAMMMKAKISRMAMIMHILKKNIHTEMIMILVPSMKMKSKISSMAMIMHLVDKAINRNRDRETILVPSTMWI